MQRVLPAAPAAVFEAFTDPELLAQWWGPTGFTTRSLDFRPRMDGDYQIEMQPPDAGSFHLRGRFREVEPPARLAFTFVWDPPDPDDVETVVELTFRAFGDATEVSLEQGEFRSEERRALHSDGWSESFEKLEDVLAGRSGPRESPGE